MHTEFACDKCGHHFPFQMVKAPKGTGVVHMTGNRVRCPMPGCGGWGHHKPGIYEFVNGVLAAFTAPGMTREKIEAAKGIVKEASEGGITTDDALSRLEAISETLAKAVAHPEGRKVNWEFLLTLFALIWTIWNDYQSDVDAQSYLKESRTQTEVARKMLEESRAQTEFLHGLSTRQESLPQLQAQTTGTKNRAERRRADALERKKKASRRP